MSELQDMPVSNGRAAREQMLMSVAQLSRSRVPMVVSHLDIRPVCDVQASVQGIDLASVASGIQRAVAPYQKNSGSPVQVDVAGQVTTIAEQFQRAGRRDDLSPSF